MRIIRRSDFKTVPWKNGGGITHEVAKVEEDGRLLWRMSLAEVASDGPFSLFPGLARILTVIEGEGMDLRDATGRIVHPVPPLTPVHFSGDEPLTGTLRSGPCLDFNLIYDPMLFVGSAEIITNAGQRVDAATEGLLCLTGSIVIGASSLARHDFAFLAAGDPELSFAGGAQALRLTLTPR